MKLPPMLQIAKLRKGRSENGKKRQPQPTTSHVRKWFSTPVSKEKGSLRSQVPHLSPILALSWGRLSIVVHCSVGWSSSNRSLARKCKNEGLVRRSVKHSRGSTLPTVSLNRRTPIKQTILCRKHTSLGLGLSIINAGDAWLCHAMNCWCGTMSIRVSGINHTSFQFLF